MEQRKMQKIKSFFTKNKEYSVTIIRIGLALVLIWFGVSQLVQPDYFLGYLPSWAFPPADTMQGMHFRMMGIVPVEAVTLIALNGMLDLSLGILLLVGFYTRIAALAAALHIFSISLSLGYNDVAVRDYGLALAALSLAFSGAGRLSFDERSKK